MDHAKRVYPEILMVIIFTLVLIFNAFLATNKLENRKHHETYRD